MFLSNNKCLRKKTKKKQLLKVASVNESGTRETGLQSFTLGVILKFPVCDFPQREMTQTGTAVTAMEGFI